MWQRKKGKQNKKNSHRQCSKRANVYSFIFISAAVSSILYCYCLRLHFLPSAVIALCFDVQTFYCLLLFLGIIWWWIIIEIGFSTELCDYFSTHLLEKREINKKSYCALHTYILDTHTVLMWLFFFTFSIFFFRVFFASPFHSHFFDSISIVTFVSVSTILISITLVYYCLCLYQQQFYYYFSFLSLHNEPFSHLYGAIGRMTEWVKMFSVVYSLCKGWTFLCYLMCCVYPHFSFILIPIGIHFC